jgi:hypothetical protein
MSTDFICVSELIPDHTGLQVCVSDSKPIKVLQWQCQGEPIADYRRGVSLTTPVHIDKALQFIQLAKQSCSDLVLTPEYSFPIEVLDQVIGNVTLWPEKGSLWCLGMQGLARQEFGEKLEQWTSIGSTLVIKDAFDRLTSSHFVDALIYLFLLDNRSLCILPQFKSIPMSDKWSAYEGPGLCTSNLIYVFDLKGSTFDQNRFLSILCSDALGIEPKEILEFTQGKDLLIFHAQLNQEPRHKDFRAFRNYFFERNTGRDVRILTLNWAEGTVIDGLKFDKPWSSFYKKAVRGELAEQQIRATNHEKGTYYTRHNYTEIWYSNRKEHCKQFVISKGFQIGAAYTATVHHEPVTQGYYIFDIGSRLWNIASMELSDSIKELIESGGPDYDYPLKADPHDCDAFFGLCFGHFLEGELSSNDDELVIRLQYGSDHESDHQRFSKAKQYNLLIRLIKKQEFPQELQNLVNNHYLNLDSFSAVERYKSGGNVYPKIVPPEQRNPFSSALFIISNSTTKEEVEKQIDEICKKLHPDFRNKVVIFYRPFDTDHYMYYDEHLKQTRIDKATFSKSLSSIKS